jgi:hypothetical protein
MICEHGVEHDHQPPCCCLPVDMHEASLVDFAKLWATFVPAGFPEWDALDPASRGQFKIIWIAQAVPYFAGVIRAVAEYDRHLKAQRN